MTHVTRADPGFFVYVDNGGGIFFLAYDLFAQLFPTIGPYGLTNLRATPIFDAAGQIITARYSDDTSLNFDQDLTGHLMDYIYVFNVRMDLTPGLTEFASWPEFPGPREIHGDNFTSAMRFNLSDPMETAEIWGDNTGHLDDLNSMQVFDPVNITLILDGYCGSTCALFAEFMKTQVGIRTIAFGGRSQHGPMQGVGGTKGANGLDYGVVLELLMNAFTKDAPEEQIATLNQTSGALLENIKQAIKRADMTGGKRHTVHHDIFLAILTPLRTSSELQK